MGEGSSATRLSDWLDPGNTGALTWGGTNSSFIFTDGFEIGDTSVWSRTVP
jgi:hypothetical protein